MQEENKHTFFQHWAGARSWPIWISPCVSAQKTRDSLVGNHSSGRRRWVWTLQNKAQNTIQKFMKKFQTSCCFRQILFSLFLFSCRLLGFVAQKNKNIKGRFVYMLNSRKLFFFSSSCIDCEKIWITMYFTFSNTFKKVGLFFWNMLMQKAFLSWCSDSK